MTQPSINEKWTKEIRVKMPLHVYEAIVSAGGPLAAAFHTKNPAAAFTTALLCGWYDENHAPAPKKAAVTPLRTPVEAVSGGAG